MALGQKEIGNRVRTYSSGLAGSASDLMLYAIRYNLDLGSQSQHQLDIDAATSLSEINFSSFKRALTHLKSKGLIEESEGTSTGYALTDQGNHEFQLATPVYRVERPWDGNVYLVNYDLPVSKNSIRNAFRDFLKNVGCGMLQHSLWLTPYDPREALMSYIDKHQLNRELVIVSRMDLAAEMYPYQIPGLIEVAFSLSKVNNSYQNYLNLVSEGLTRERQIFEFLKVLKTDPQVPYDLIPEVWVGYQAYDSFKNLL